MKKNMTFKKWLVVGVLGFGVPEAVAFIIAFWTSIKQSYGLIPKILLAWIIGGVLCGGSMYIYCRIVLILKNKLKS
ncbi:hypothetical protein FACS1894142_3810 [Spirochaetia bacterium]|nr:hypothetical protein FACS1894142_3810 [Spirochaetia bacterium]